MKKTIQISECRIAVIEASLQFNKENIERVAQEVNRQLKEFPRHEQEERFFTLGQECLLNEKEDCAKPRVKNIAILSPEYKKRQTLLNENDLVLIQDAIQELFIELRKEPFTLNDYYC